jgi:hypothetical protein
VETPERIADDQERNPVSLHDAEILLGLETLRGREAMGATQAAVSRALTVAADRTLMECEARASASPTWWCCAQGREDHTGTQT